MSIAADWGPRAPPMAGPSSATDPETVLVVDDLRENRERVGEILRAAGWDVEFAASGEEALDRLSEQTFGLVVLDIVMPGMNGMETCRLVRTRHHALDLPVVLVSSLCDPASRVRGKAAGADEFLSRPIDPTELEVRVANLLRLRRFHRRLAAHATTLEQAVQHATSKLHATIRELRVARHSLDESRDEVVLRLAAAAEFRDEQTGRHVHRVGRYSELLAARLGMGRGFCERLRLAAILHDVGKIGIPDRVLLKQGPLDEEEIAIIRTHPDVGRRILGNSQEPMLQLAATIAWTHHERWNGEGYPRGLRGEAIPLPGRIVAVADVFDALSSRRPYKAVLPLQDCVDIIRDQQGRQFDPTVVRAFGASLDEVERIHDEFADEELAESAHGGS